MWQAGSEQYLDHSGSTAVRVRPGRHATQLVMRSLLWSAVSLAALLGLLSLRSTQVHRALIQMHCVLMASLQRDTREPSHAATLPQMQLTGACEA